MENKTGRYFKYAFGEIILVVIGILIALSINNWNEERILHSRESKILDTLLEDLKQAEKMSSDLIVEESLVLKRYEYALGGNQARETLLEDPKIDSLFHELIFDVNIESPVINSYTDLKNAGETSLISDEEIRSKFTTLENSLTKLSDGLKDRLTVQQIRMDDIAMNKMNFVQSVKGATSDYNIDYGESNNYESLLNDQQVLNAFAIKLIMTENVIRDRNRLLLDIKELIQLIKEYLSAS